MPEIACPSCGQTFTITAEQWPQYAGRSITCTRCHQPFPVGGGAAPAPAPAPAYAAPGATYAAGAPPRKGMSGGMIALLIGGGVLAVLVVIVALLASILLPSLNRAREQANRIKCANNLRQISVACLMYSNADVRGGGRFPDTIDRLVVGEAAQDLAPSVFACPSTTDTPSAGATPQAVAADLKGTGHLSYVYVGNVGGRDGKGLRSADSGGDAVLLYEPLGNHGNQGCNMAFADGHIEFILKAKAERIVGELKAGHNPPRPTVVGP